MQMQKLNLTIKKKNEILEKAFEFQNSIKRISKIWVSFFIVKNCKKMNIRFFKSNSGDATCQIKTGIQKKSCKKRKEIDLSKIKNRKFY